MPDRKLFLLVVIVFSLIGSLFSNNMAMASPPFTTHIEPFLSSMSLEEKIGQLFMIAADGDLENLVRVYHVGGIVLFSRHTETLSQTMQLIERVRLASPIPPLVAVDQEGGRISRLPFATPVPDARRLGVLSDSSLQNIGMLVGRELHALGFNMNFAPVLDVDTCVENPVIGNRSFSQDPYIVARLGSAYIRGLHFAGVAATAKHFPGHGDTSTDSHFALPVVNQTEERLQSLELLPFRAAIRSNVDAIMMAHVAYPSLDPKPNWPASLSYTIITATLRNELDYKGIIITDAMNMKAITNFNNPVQSAKTSFQAGVDIVLMPEDLPAVYQALLLSVRNGEIPVKRVNDSVRRVLSLKLRLTDGPAIPFGKRLAHAQKTVGSPAHRLLLEQIVSGIVPQVESLNE